jgi:Glyoxalase-like domain
VDGAAHFWGGALGRTVDPGHPGSRGNYRMLETPPDEPIAQIQRVNHESRVHIDIETDDIPAEVTRLEKLGARVVDRVQLRAKGAMPGGAEAGSASTEGQKPLRAVRALPAHMGP